MSKGFEIAEPRKLNDSFAGSRDDLWACLHNASGCGAAGNMTAFTTRFIEGRLAGFEKDMPICLTSVDSPTGSGKTHAYFPALAAYCGFREP
jgi:hypothetical protein